MAEIQIKQAISNADNSLVGYYTPEAAIYDSKGIRLDVKLDSLNPDAIRAQLSGAQVTLSALTETCREQIQSDQAEDRESINKLYKYLFPLKPQFGLTLNSGGTSCDITFRIRGVDFENGSLEETDLTPSSVTITKIVNGDDSNVVEIYDGANNTGWLNYPISGSVEEYTMIVTKAGRDSVELYDKRYICAFGASSISGASESLFNSLKKVLAKGLKSCPEVKTTNGQYIWIIVPSELSISRVVCSGFDVPMAAAQDLSITSSANFNGEYKAYRSQQALDNATWKLMIN